MSSTWTNVASGAPVIEWKFVNSTLSAERDGLRKTRDACGGRNIYRRPIRTFGEHARRMNTTERRGRAEMSTMQKSAAAVDNDDSTDYMFST